MKYTVRKGYTGSIRKVWPDDKSRPLALVGTIEDLLMEGVLDSCSGHDSGTWMCIPAATIEGDDQAVGFGLTRDEAVRNARFAN